MMQTAAVQKISEQNSPYKAMLDRAYMIGYTDAMNQDRSRRRAARERRERKKYFAMQKLNGVALLIFTAVAIKILEGDATIAFITVPLGLSMLLSKEMLIINKYYTEHPHTKAPIQRATQHCLKVWCTRPLNSKQICQRRKRREKQARHNQTSTIRTQDGI